MFKSKVDRQYLVLFFIAILMSFVFFNPTFRQMAKDFIIPNERQVLSLINTTFNFKSYKVIKVKSGRALFVEIYSWNDKDSEFSLVDSVQLTDTKDAFYRLDGESSNLFLKDIDDDNFPEILTPSFDKNMVARLNVFSFDIQKGKLVKLSEH